MVRVRRVRLLGTEAAAGRSHVMLASQGSRGWAPQPRGPLGEGGGWGAAGPRLPSPRSLCAVRVTGDLRPGLLSVQVTVEPEAHRDLGRARRLLWLQEPLRSWVRPSSTAPPCGCPFTSQEK